MRLKNKMVANHLKKVEEKEIILKKEIIERLKKFKDLSKEYNVANFSKTEKRAFILGADVNKLIPSHWYDEIIKEAEK